MIRTACKGLSVYWSFSLELSRDAPNKTTRPTVLLLSNQQRGRVKVLTDLRPIVVEPNKLSHVKCNDIGNVFRHFFTDNQSYHIANDHGSV